VFLVLVLEGSGYHLDTLLKWVREVWEFLWEVGVRAVVEVPVLEAVSSLAWAASGVGGGAPRGSWGKAYIAKQKDKDMDRIVQHAPRRLTRYGASK
jgi:hypothetical protein